MRRSNQERSLHLILFINFNFCRVRTVTLSWFKMKLLFVFRITQSCLFQGCSKSSDTVILLFQQQVAKFSLRITIITKFFYCTQNEDTLLKAIKADFSFNVRTLLFYTILFIQEKVNRK